MQTLFDRRRALGLLAAGALLIGVIIAGVALARRPAGLGQIAGALAGASAPADALPLPGKTAGASDYLSLRPVSDDRFCLASTTEALSAAELKFHVRAYVCQNDWNYLWHFEPEERGGLVYRPKLMQQKWQDPLDKKGGYVELYCLDVEGGSLSNNATVTTFWCKTSNYQNQLWYLGAGSQAGQYRLHAYQSGKCLSLSEALTESNHPYTLQTDCDKATEFFVRPLEILK